MSLRPVHALGRAGAVPMTAVLLATGLSACATSPAPSDANALSPPPAVSGTALLAQVRDAGKLGVELDVQPLRDPQVEDLRARARAAEARGEHAAAEAEIVRALALSPDDPDLLQWRAELALARGDVATAADAARRSYDTGPKVGGLCRRNWTTLQLAAESRGDVAAAGEARTAVAGCKVAPPVRM